MASGTYPPHTCAAPPVGRRSAQSGAGTDGGGVAGRDPRPRRKALAALRPSPGPVRRRRRCARHGDDPRLDPLGPGVDAGTGGVEAGTAARAPVRPTPSRSFLARHTNGGCAGGVPGRRREAVMPPCAARTLPLVGEGCGAARTQTRLLDPPPRRRKLGLLHRPPAPLASLGGLQLLAPRLELCPCRCPRRSSGPWTLHLALEPGIQEADRQSA